MVKIYKLKVGSRAQVMHGTAKLTGGGLTKRQLKYNKHGKIVSIKASNSAKKNKNLIKAGYITKKGKFGFVIKKGGSFLNRMRKSLKKSRKRSRNKKNGNPENFKKKYENNHYNLYKNNKSKVYLEIMNSNIGKTKKNNINQINFGQQGLNHMWTRPYITSTGETLNTILDSYNYYVKQYLLNKQKTTDDINEKLKLNVGKATNGVDNIVFSCNNRRLLLLKALCKKGIITNIECTITTCPLNFDKAKYTNEKTNVRIDPKLHITVDNYLKMYII